MLLRALFLVLCALIRCKPLTPNFFKAYAHYAVYMVHFNSSFFGLHSIHVMSLKGACSREVFLLLQGGFSLMYRIYIGK